MGENLNSTRRARPARSRWHVIEPFSCYSHLIGVLLAISGLVVLLGLSRDDPWRLVGFSVYGSSLILLYLASTVYHWLLLPIAQRKWLKRFDHVAIFLLIAGTYTPVCLVTLRGGWGWSVFGVVWGVALAGTILKLCFRSLPPWVSAAIYLAMGWIALVAVVPLVRAFPLPALLWLLAGGLLYTVGAVIYATRRPNPLPRVFGFHEIFHLFVLGGSISHFVFMLRWVVPS
ncbi:MAG TPA: hemolysin III family protein [Candidatus Binatia bacterium]|nr:hemolysin III family protein [Candidatus Binatia bacterium]